MSVVDSLAVAAAARLERAVGATGALSSYRAIARRAPPGEARARALSGMLRGALSARDEAALGEAIAWWPHAGWGEHGQAAIEACKELARRGQHVAAVRLAEAEAKRSGTARALYLHGRTLELAGDDARATWALSQAVERAEREGAGDVAAAAKARIAEIRARSSRGARTGDSAGGSAAPAETATVAIEDPRRALPMHVGRLAAATSRFARASALSSIEEIARLALARGDRPTAEAAILSAARHADREGARMTPMEIDRIAVVLRLWPAPGESAAAIARLHALGAVASAEADDARDDAVVRAADVAPELAEDLGRARALLPALASGPPWSAAAASWIVAALRRAEDAGREIPSPAWTALRLALADASLRKSALAVARARVPSAVGSPPRGFLPFAHALAAAGDDDTALAALRRAHAAGEPRARDALVAALVRRGHALAARADRHDRDAALAALREAKALAARGR